MCRWTDARDDERILFIFLATRLTILTPASLRDVEKEEGPAGDRINACRELREHVRVLPEEKEKSWRKLIYFCFSKRNILLVRNVVFQMRYKEVGVIILAFLAFMIFFATKILLTFSALMLVDQ